MRYKKLDDRISRTALEVICALCADYPRRKRIVECRFIKNTEQEDLLNFKKTNDLIDEALLCVDEGIRMYILMDIANQNGYNKSMASPFICKNSYYKQKNNAINLMAQKFNLILRY